MTLNLIETLKTSITQNTSTNYKLRHFPTSFLFKKQYFQNFQAKKKSAFYVVFYGIIYIVEGHTA